MPADVTITDYTDAACPWAFSAEPFRLHLDWLYGDAIEWRLCMVGLSESPEEYEGKGLTPAVLAQAYSRISEDHGMPIDSAEPARMQATVPACRAVAAARLHAPERERALLRRLQVLNFSGRLLDEPDTIATAAAEAGIDGELAAWLEDPAVEDALRTDMHEARHPRPEALAMDARLADWEGGRRYTCPSYEFERVADGARLAAPGFQPWRVSAVAMANLLPHADVRATPADVAEVLEWADHPLATREVAEICEIDLREARQRLSRVATEEPVGADGYWALA